MSQPPKDENQKLDNNRQENKEENKEQAIKEEDPFAGHEGTLYEPEVTPKGAGEASPPLPSVPDGKQIISGYPTELGSYIIDSPIGAGGMGMVYKGRHKLERIAAVQGPVAIKMIAPELAKNPQFRARFEQEAAIGMQIIHPNIAKVLNVHVDDAQLACIMAFVPGLDLKEVMEQQQMSQESVFELLGLLSDAIDHFHAQEIFHRDLKPANIKIRPDGTPVILDFGIAKAEGSKDQGLTQTGQSMGTPKYMAPEQMSAKHVDERADQYSLALIAYELFCGMLPWEDGISAFDLYDRKKNGGLVSLVERGVDEDVSKAVMKGLNAAPEERYGSCSELVAAIKSEQIVTHESSDTNEPVSEGEQEAQATVKREAAEEKIKDEDQQNERLSGAGFKSPLVLVQIALLGLALTITLMVAKDKLPPGDVPITLRLTCIPIPFFVLAHWVVRRVKTAAVFWGLLLAEVVVCTVATHLFLIYLNPRYSLYDTTTSDQRNIVAVIYVLTLSTGLIADKIQAWRGTILSLVVRYSLLLALIHFLLVMRKFLS